MYPYLYPHCMQKSFVQNIAIMVFANLLIKPLWIFGIDRNVQNVVGDAAYGSYAAFSSIGIILNILLDIGLTNYNTNLIAQDTTLLKKILPNMVIAKSILSFAYIIVMCIIFFVLKYPPALFGLFISTAIIQILVSAIAYFRSNISAFQLFKTDAILSILDKIVIIIIFYLGFKNTNNLFIHTYTNLQIIGLLVTLVASVVFTKKINTSGFSIDITLVKNILKQSLPYAVLILLMAFYFRSDMFLLERWCGNVASGQYAKCFRILDACNMVGFLFAGMLLPMLSKQLKDKINIQPTLDVSVTLLMPFAIGVTLFCMFNSNKILSTLYHVNNSSISAAFIYTMLALPGFAIMNIFSTTLTANKSISTFIKIATIASIISFVANCIFTPKYNLISVAIIGAITHSLSAILYLYFAKKIVQIKLSHLLKVTLLSIIIMGGINVGCAFLKSNIVINILLNIMGGLLTYYILGIFKKEQRQFLNI